MFKKIIRSYLVNILALYLVSIYIGGFHLAKGWQSLLEVGAGFTLIHLLLRPILGLVTGPLNFLTFGLIGLILDAGLLYGLTMFFPEVFVTSWYFPGFITSYVTLEPMTLTILEIVVCVLLVGTIILQAKGTGLGSAWGGSGEMYQSRRGVEKVVFRFTIILAVLFGALSIASVILK